MSSPANPTQHALCPWQAPLEAYFSEFMQFFYPLAHAEIHWDTPVEFLTEAIQTIRNDIPMPLVPLQALAKVRLHTGIFCHLYIFIGWQPEPDLAQHMARVQSLASLHVSSPIACFALLAQPAPTQPVTGFSWNCLGSQLGYYFTSHYFSDFADQEPDLITDDNAFAFLSLGQLVKQATLHDMATRFTRKWHLVQSMFHRGWSRDRIITLFLALDWSLPLPLRWSQQLWRNIEQFEEQQIMRYVSSVERFVRENERQQGYIQGQANMLRAILIRRFGDLPLWAGMQLQDGNCQLFGLWLERALSASSIEEVFHEANPVPD